MLGDTTLQYGALGLAAIVIGLVAKYISDREKARSERDAAAEVQRQRDSEFIQDLVKAGLATNAETELAFRQLSTQSIEAQQKMAQALERLCERAGQADVQHRDLLAAVQRCGQVQGGG